MLGYLDAVDPGQCIDVRLAGVPRRIYRARLGLHLRLSRLAQDFDEEPDAGAIHAYLEACGLPDEGTGVERLAAYVALRLLNEWQWDLPWMTQPGDPEHKPPAYEYEDRTWAWWLHKLASRYGWSRDQIFDLYPEEAACYLQEIFVAEFDETDQQRSLSELAYKYDKGAQTSRFVPTPRPGWMVGMEAPKTRKVHRRAVPVGNVISLDDGRIH
jgi:hypothetical protein